jgi:hypothetical protein
VEAGSILSGLAAANSIAAATCAVTLITCEAFLTMFAAAAVAAIYYKFMANSYAQCRSVHGYNCGINPYDWQPCNGGGGTGGETAAVVPGQVGAVVVLSSAGGKPFGIWMATRL